MTILIEETHDQFMHLKVASKSSNFHCLLTVIYAKNAREERRTLWQELLRIGPTITEPWCICRDYNSPLLDLDRIGGQHVSESETKDLQQVINVLNLTDMKSTGRRYTWTNGHI
ncbi:hypothetical protein RDI58_008994 [Solanum bulbocastanum]|uniref:Endonuclease/exonuclease/phosphatase domain-containing protein n=1 Tax=Solanum bulbocastanum TaxID=147425 RepID=A0AAN8TX71_SOLBU